MESTILNCIGCSGVTLARVSGVPGHFEDVPKMVSHHTTPDAPWEIGVF